MSCVNFNKYWKYVDTVATYTEGSTTKRYDEAVPLAENDWKAFVAANSTRDEVEMIQKIGWDVQVRYNGSAPVVESLVGIEIDGDVVTVYLAGKNESVKKYSFPKGSMTSSKTDKGTFVVIEGLTDGLYGSDEAKIDKNNFEKVELELLNNIENSEKMLDELMDMQDTSDVHRERLKSTLRLFVDDFKKVIPSMNVYMYKKAEKAGGMLQSRGWDDDGVYVGASEASKAVKNEQSNGEVYVEEIVHAATVFAMKFGGEEAKVATRKLQELREKVAENLEKRYDGNGWKAFMPVESIDVVYEEKIAKDMWKYMFANEKTGLEEFVAKGLSWEVMVKELDEMKVNVPEEKPVGIIEQIVYWVKKLYNAARMKWEKEGFDTTASDMLVRLSVGLSDANNGAIGKVANDSENIVKGMMNKVDNLDSKMSRIIKEYVNKKKDFRRTLLIEQKPLPGAGKWEYLKYTGKLLPGLIGDREGKAILKDVLNALGAEFSGDLQTQLKHMMTADTVERAVERLAMINDNIDRSIRNKEAISANQIVAAFGSISKKEKEALTLVGLDTDISSVYGKVDLEKVLRSDEEIAKEIESRRDELRGLVDEKTMNYYMAQINGLGWYLATHQAGVAQLLNAKNIANGLNRELKIDASDRVVELIDELATLEGLKYSEKEARDMMAELVKREPDGIDYVMRFHKGVKELAKEKSFSDSEELMIKGYSKELFDEDITIQIAPVVAENVMKKEGFKLAKKMKAHNGVEMAVYINKWHAQQNLKKGAMRLTNVHRKGTTFGELSFMLEDDPKLAAMGAKLEVTKLKPESLKAVREMEAGKYKVEKREGSVVPIYNRNGDIVNYRYMMNKRDKRELLGQDLNAASVLGKTFGSVYDKESAEEQNKKVIDIMLEDAKNVKKGSRRGKNGEAYYRIGKNVSDPEMREIYAMMPDSIKDVINTQPEQRLAVRADMMKYYFGMRELGTMEVIEKLPLVGKVIGATVPGGAKYLSRMVDDLWTAVISVAKVDVVIRTPMVLVGNVVSNIALSVQYGFSPAKVVKYQADAVKGLKDYIEKTHEIVKIESDILAGRGSANSRDKLVRLKEDLKKHQVAELIDDGMLQAIIEDIGSDEIKSRNRISRIINDKLERTPGIIRDGVDLLWVTENTKIFKMISTATQFSDFAARYAQYEMMKERSLEDIRSKSVNGMVRVGDLRGLEDVEEKNQIVNSVKAKEIYNRYARQTVLDAYVNYGKPEGQIVDWMNRMGLVMFTKYFMRIQRAISKNVVDHPLYLLAAILGQALITDIDTIDDQSLISKNYEYIFKNPISNLENAMMPTGYEAIRSLF